MNHNYTSLTGRIRFRLSLTRKLILVVEYGYSTANLRGPGCGRSYVAHDWRDATATDLADLVALKVLPGEQMERPRRLQIAERAA